MRDLVTRFAPSPTGYLHLGHVYSAWAGYAAAKTAGGRFLLRIEDIDSSRCRPEFEKAIFEDLAWLGFTWETPVRRQSEQLDDYRSALEKLDRLGVLYPCFCSRKDIAEAVAAPHGPDGPIYPGTCRLLAPSQAADRIAAGHPYAQRLDVAKALALTGPLTFHDRHHGEVRARPDLLGDVVLARRDTPASYHLCVTLDDHIQAVNLVTRGEDLFLATHTHRVLQALMGLDVPEYAHHPLLTNAAGQRLSKRDGAQSVRRLRENGQTAAETRALAGIASNPTGSVEPEDFKP